MTLDDKLVSMDQFAYLVREGLVDDETLSLFGISSVTLANNAFNVQGYKDYVNAYGSRRLNLTKATGFPVDWIDRNKFGDCQGPSIDSWKCGTFFTRFYGSSGFCFTFNALSAEEILRPGVLMDSGDNTIKSENWSKETGYRTQRTPRSNEHPQRAFSSAKSLGVMFSMFLLPKNSPPTLMKLEKVFVNIHNPYDMPWKSEKRLTMKSGSVNNILVEPQMIKAGDGLRDMYEPEKRMCYFDGERELRYFNNYSESNCELECLTNYTLKNCGCVAYWMPRE